MWPFRRNDDENQVKFSNSAMIAVVVAAISLAISVGVARWSWLLLDEQVQLRTDFEELKARQDQVGIQYEFWLKQVQDEQGSEGAGVRGSGE
jgi:hypothetical protein